MKKKLKLGLLINSYELCAWQYALLDRLMNCDIAIIELVIINDGNRNNNKNIFSKIKNSWRDILYIIYNKLDRLIFKSYPDAFEKKDSI